MRGHDAIVQARLAGETLARIDIDVLPESVKRHGWARPGVEWHAGVPVGRIEVEEGENPALLDLRCCRGLPVLLMARSYVAGWPVAERVAEVEPAVMNFCAPDFAARVTTEGVESWGL